MKKSIRTALALTLLLIPDLCPTFAGVESTAIRETAEIVMRKFGKGIAGETIEQVTEATTKAVAKYGDDCIPLLRKAGHSGYRALLEAGDQAPDIIKLYARKGDKAIWIISEPKKLAIFIKHGENAADALIKHPGIAEELISKFGDNAVGALNQVSRSSGQKLGIMASDGTLATMGRQSELLDVVGKYGDGAMDFIWKNKGSLAVATVLATFLADPSVYISGAKTLVVDPVVNPIVKTVNWTLIIILVCAVAFAPVIVKSVKATMAAARSETAKNTDKDKIT